MEKSMESSVSYRKRKFMCLSIGLVASIGVMVVYQQLDGVTGQHHQAEAVTPKDQEAVPPNVHDPVSPRDKEAELLNENESVLPSAVSSFASTAVACWLEGRPGHIECMTNPFWCILPGWKRVPPAPPYCSVYY
jgi:hypothetical protein